jgi:hypothetical protein
LQQSGVSRETGWLHSSPVVQHQSLPWIEWFLSIQHNKREV